jgi:hypothetical protein
MMVLQFLSRFAAADKNAIPKSRPQHTAAVVCKAKRPNRTLKPDYKI